MPICCAITGDGYVSPDFLSSVLLSCLHREVYPFFGPVTLMCARMSTRSMACMHVSMMFEITQLMQWIHTQ